MKRRDAALALAVAATAMLLPGPARGQEGPHPDATTPATSAPETVPAPAAPVSTETKAEMAIRKADEAVKKFDELVDSLPFKLHGGAYLYYYQPFAQKGARNKFELYAAYFTLDYCFDDTVGFHFEPRFRDTKLRPYFNSNIWVQEVYAYANTPVGVIKGGKEYEHLGIFWDDSFYGNMQYFDGFKLNPNYGFSFEGSTADWKFAPGLKDSPFALDYSAQFFVNDGSTEGALDQHDVLSYNARKRDIVAVRIAPSFKPTDDVKITIGGFGEDFRADFGNPDQSNNVDTFGGDVRVDIGPWSGYGEYTKRNGMTAPDYPIKGADDHHKTYVLAGTKIEIWKFVFRLNVSHVRYEDVKIEETLFVPQVIVNLHKHVSLLVEYAYWWRHVPGNDAHLLQDSSLNCVLTVSF
jgi:hypothetical protein